MHDVISRLLHRDEPLLPSLRPSAANCVQLEASDVIVFLLWFSFVASFYLLVCWFSIDNNDTVFLFKINLGLKSEQLSKNIQQVTA